jgi:hypothetical protein
MKSGFLAASPCISSGGTAFKSEHSKGNVDGCVPNGAAPRYGLAGSGRSASPCVPGPRTTAAEQAIREPPCRVLSAGPATYRKLLHKPSALSVGDVRYLVVIFGVVRHMLLIPFLQQRIKIAAIDNRVGHDGLLLGVGLVRS